jgi:hypothetical protein
MGGEGRKGEGRRGEERGKEGRGGEGKGREGKGEKKEKKNQFCMSQHLTFFSLFSGVLKLCLC